VIKPSEIGPADLPDVDGSESAFDVATVQAVARTHEIRLTDSEAGGVVQSIAGRLPVFARIAVRLHADDDPHLFRRLLEREGRV
jgi:hypothetical protein